MEAKTLKNSEIKYLEEIRKMTLGKDEAIQILKNIKDIIDKELCNYEKNPNAFNLLIINLATRTYFETVEKYEITENYFDRIYEKSKSALSIKDFLIIQSLLQTNHFKESEFESMRLLCHEALGKAIDENHSSLLIILRCLNLFCKKLPELEMSTLCLDQIYFCLECGQNSIKDEVLHLLNNFCLNKATALGYFVHIVNFWPWTNRNKFYALGSIFTKNSLQEFLLLSGYDKKDFLNGIRVSLYHKNLLAPSQSLIKKLSDRASDYILPFIADILTKGSEMEIRNLYTHWIPYVYKKDQLFDIIQQILKEIDYIENDSNLEDNLSVYRSIILLSIFSKHVFNLSKLYFFKFSTELITNCFQFNLDVQLHIFAFIVDNLENFAIEDSLEFIYHFIESHKSVESSHFRNSIFAKMPNVINYTAKIFARLGEPSSAASITKFFKQLQQLCEQNMNKTLYQPKIFSLKMIEILMNSLYIDNVKRNAKNCQICENEKLGSFLKSHNVINMTEMWKSLYISFDDTSTAFEDTRETTLNLMQLMPAQAPNSSTIEMCKKMFSSDDIDKCYLSSIYARILLQNDPRSEDVCLLVHDIIARLDASIKSFKEDPLLACKSKAGHLFCYITVLDTIAKSRAGLILNSISKILCISESIVNTILDMLSLSNTTYKQYNVTFEDMDQSLEMLIARSAYVSENHEEDRKFLITSFWFSLRACSDIASTLGCLMVKTSETSDDDWKCLQACFHIIESILIHTRHKGAIEAAGSSIGLLTKNITLQLPSNSRAYSLVCTRVQHLYQLEDNFISTSRRGAGFSIMILHIVKNENKRSGYILQKTVTDLLKILNLQPFEVYNDYDKANCDRIEALVLHYLCVLVKDAEIKEVMSPYYSEILMATVKYIDSAEWTTYNASLQLFSSLVNKITAQRTQCGQCDLEDSTLNWESSDITFSDILRKFPIVCDYILSYCLSKTTSTQSILLFLGFLQKMEYLHENKTSTLSFLQSFRQLTWDLLSHQCEKIRKLASSCFIRAHEFTHELPLILLQISEILFKVKNENFFEGLIFTVKEGCLKIKHESRFMPNIDSYDYLMEKIRNIIESNCSQIKPWSVYTLCKLLDLLLLLNFDQKGVVIKNVIKWKTNDKYCIGYDLWLNCVDNLTIRLKYPPLITWSDAS
uniref:DUF2428 domain-containing protein n=1 Tax=Glossina pallidipes TaxID=7398 RepID=A0A1B0AHH5_GLOPL